MLHISVSIEDGVILRQIIESSLVDLRKEIWHTDSREFRELLKQRAAALERVLEELSAAATPAV
ncbi:MAG TPA: hypothetical protein VK886_00990 [Vicinamibacterales bacterium]|nr:hypothetical protein [Vicinamibacterales bacterium]